MDVDSIGAALRRKLGPLPVWIWAIFGGAVLYFLRKRGYFGGLGAAQGQTLQPSQANATPPQTQVPLQPGESVYDPNTGALSTAPGGDGGGASGIDPSQAIDDLATAIAGGFTTTVKVDQATPARHAKAPKKPTKGKGKRKGGARKKPAHHQKPHHTTAHPHPGHKTRARSKTTHRNVGGGRTAPRKKSTDRHIGPAPAPSGPKNRVYRGAAAATTTRQRPTVGIVRTTAPRQHPVSSHPARGTAHPGGHRPSAPPPRTQRPQAVAKRAPARRKGRR